MLSYHVVADRLLETRFGEVTDDSAAPFTPETLEGSTLKIDIEEDTDPGVVLNNVAYLDKADITAGNDVVHTIDAVLVPGVMSDGAEDTRGGGY